MPRERIGRSKKSVFVYVVCLQTDAERVVWFVPLANTWHHGLVARWWAEFCFDGPEIEYFKNAIERSGEPALDVGCGAGRILVPCVEAGMEVRGSDASGDMIRHCRARLEALGLDANLMVAPTHELAVHPIYRIIISCGVFGVGTNREEDLEGLRRLRKLLMPGGVFIFDFYLPGESLKEWATWTKHQRPILPSRWSKPDARKTRDADNLVRSNSIHWNSTPFEKSALSTTKTERWLIVIKIGCDLMFILRMKYS